MRSFILKYLHWIIPFALCLGFWLPVTGFIAPIIIGLNCLVAAGSTRLFFPQLFMDLFTNQKAIKNPSATPGYNEFQIGRYRLGWIIFFGVWAMLNVLKFWM
ncbi:hypothetical protein [Ekhidna sp.]|jgi:hypothetical protein|uniref:hypothetical protein n=1 Tax=Ekhidna sp. TaxID=2608089 RepID=UPI0032ED0BD1